MALPSPTTPVEFVGNNDFGVLALASMHSNGHIREAAIRMLALRSTGEELPFILIRINDWVAPIRELTRDIVWRRIDVANASHFLRCLPLVLRIARCGRAEHQWLLDSLSALFSKAECESVLRSGFGAVDREVRRACLRIAVSANAPSVGEALAAALEDRDPMTRLWAAKQLLSGTPRESLPDLYEILSCDPFMPVRREAMDALVRSNSDGAQAALLAALFDRHSAMRELARFHLRDKLDVAHCYREALTTSRGAKLVATIRGLGECGVEADADRVGTFLNSTLVSLRRAAVGTVGRLASERFQEELLRALADESPGVSAEARLALERIIHNDLIECVLVLLREHPQPVVRKNALRLVCKMGKWKQLPGILAACRDPSIRVSSAAITAVRAWWAKYNRSFAAPSDAEIAQAAFELRESQNLLARAIVQELKTLFEQWTS